MLARPSAALSLWARGGAARWRLVSTHTSATGVLTIRLADGRRRNPLSSATMEALTAAFGEAAASSESRVVLLTADGPASGGITTYDLAVKVD